MKAGRGALYVAGAAIGAGLAYLLAVVPMGSPPATTKSDVAAKKGDGKGRAPPAPVTAATVMVADMPVILMAPGTVEPCANVAVKTRVDGQIIEVLFREGDLVNQGDVLFRLDDRLIKAQIAQAEASIARDQATLRTPRPRWRAGKCSSSGRSSPRPRSISRAMRWRPSRPASPRARRCSSTQKTQLDYLTIRAPITGRTGSLSAKVGAMVRGVDAAAALVTINQTKPIWVTFSRAAERARRAQGARRQGAADIRVGGAKPTVVPGTIGFVDNQVDKQTGTIVVKVLAENADEVLWPGLSVEVALMVEVKVDMPSVPATAVLPAQQGMIAWVIGPENKVAPRTVKVERIVGQRPTCARASRPASVSSPTARSGWHPARLVTIDEPRRPPGRAPASEEHRMNGRG